MGSKDSCVINTFLRGPHCCKETVGLRLALALNSIPSTPLRSALFISIEPPWSTETTSVQLPGIGSTCNGAMKTFLLRDRSFSWCFDLHHLIHFTRPFSEPSCSVGVGGAILQTTTPTRRETSPHRRIMDAIPCQHAPYIMTEQPVFLFICVYIF